MANSIFSYDNTLPGVITEIDSKLASDYDTSLFGTTDSVCIIGTAFDGPVGIASPVYSVEHAMYLFGKNYDAETRKEASLVTGIENAWNLGCRTIYGMRINGKEMFKDFNFCADTDYRLRIQSRYPSNLGKQCYVKYDNIDGQETFTIYKPIERATINEKMNGLVDDSADAVMVNEIRIGEDYGFTKASRLSDIIDIVNNHEYNNVIELQIIDALGNVVTNDNEAGEVTLGHVFPGVYFIGRKESACDKQTVVDVKLVINDGDALPYQGFKGKYFQVLKVNTDVAKDLPIYYTSLKEMRSILVDMDNPITMIEADDYLKVAKESAKAFVEDDVDYEEMDLTNFQIYQKLGEGFAITAVAEKRGTFILDENGEKILTEEYQKKLDEGKITCEALELVKDVDKYQIIERTPKIHQAELTDPLRVQPTGDGIYSVLEDTKIRYHVLANDICADTVISGKLPKYTQFKTTVRNDQEALINAEGDALITISSKVDADDATAAKAYEFSFFTCEKPELARADIHDEEVAVSIGFGTAEDIEAISNAKGGELATDGTNLYESNEKGVFVVVTDAKYNGLYLADGAFYTVEDGAVSAASIEEKYAIVKTNNDVFLADASGVAAGKFAAGVDAALSPENDNDLFVFYTDSCVGTNKVLIAYPFLDTIILQEFVELLNESELGKMFDFTLTQEGHINRDDYVTELVAETATAEGSVATMEADRERGWDYTKHIPYTTTDNFARHLAQHCTYTELKTYPTHGIIGCKRVSDVSKTSLAEKVAEVKEFNWNMYVKTNYGKNMLDANNMPYNIGRNVSVTLFQQQFTTSSNYTAIVNGATAYAGFISQLDIGQSSTGQTIGVTPMFEFTRSQLQGLSDLGVVTVKNSFTQGYVVTDGITMAPNSDLLRRLFNTRVMHFVEEFIRSACEPFIGKANSTANRNSLSTAITSNLNSIVDTLIRRFEFSIRDEDNVDQYTYIDIDYVIVPMNEIREIRNYIRVQNQ